MFPYPFAVDCRSEPESCQQAVSFIFESSSVMTCKVVAYGPSECKQNVVREIEIVTKFVYLGSLITSENDCIGDIKRRIDKAKRVHAGFNTILKNKTIWYQTKLKILKTGIFSTALYACETWMMKKTDTKKLLALKCSATEEY